MQDIDDIDALRAAVQASIEDMERQAADPNLPRSARNKMAWAAMRRKQLVARHPEVFGVSNAADSKPTPNRQQTQNRHKAGTNEGKNGAKRG